MGRTVILVELTWTRDKDPRVPLGHGSLLAALRELDGLRVESLVVPVEHGSQATGASTAHRILALANGIAPEDVDVAFGAYVWGEAVLRETLSQLRAAGFAGRVIVGGPQVSYAERGLEALYPEADAFVRGYGEDALCALVQRVGRVAIPGVHWAGSEDLERQAAVELAALPSPWLTGTIPLDGQRFVRWETQRGCPFRCAFCQHREAGEQLRRRFLPMERLEAEIDLFCEAEVHDIAVLDPIFNLADHAVPVLERFVAHGFAGRLSLQCRAEKLTPAFLDAAQQLDVCLELGLQTIHKEEGGAVRRGNNLAKVDAALAELRERGIEHEVSLIFGLPLQTLSSFESSVQWCLERQVPVIKAFPLLLLRGTQLDRERARWALEDDGSFMPMVQRSSTFDREEWGAMLALSGALKATESGHPRTVEELWGLVGDESQLQRFRPAG